MRALTILKFAVPLMLAGAALAIADSRSAAKLDLSGYVLTFSAEFDDPSLRLPGAVFATQYVNWGGLRTLKGNRERQIYVDALFDAGGDAPLGVDPFRIEDGLLIIEAAPATPEVRAATGFDYTSGLITTEPSFTQRYGYFEMRAQLPRGRGLWPAFWMVAETHDAHLEFDVFEVLGHDTDRIYHSASSKPRKGGTHQWSYGVDSADGMHVYGLEWTPDTVIWYVDGRETARMANFHDVPMYLLANLAVGGKWPGDPNETTPFPAHMKIDYIRAYQREERLGAAE